MNILDICVLGIIIFFSVMAYRKGFIKACFGFLPMLIALLATKMLQPELSKMIRATPLYESLKTTISNSLNLENIIAEKTLETQTDIISQMNLPEFMKSALIENNNPVVYNILDVGSIQDYISGFIANTCINIITMVVIFAAIYIICRLLLATLNIFARLPILSFFNKISGLAVGFLQGVVVVWLCCIVLTFFNYKPAFQSIFVLLNDSVVALKFYENNFLLFMILRIFT